MKIKQTKNGKTKRSKSNLWKIAFGFFVVLLLVPQTFAFGVNDVLGAKSDIGCVADVAPQANQQTDQQYRCLPIQEPMLVPPIWPQPPKIDVVFVVDSTGSMADEIRSVKMHLINLINEVRNGQPSPDLRVGVSTYRDHPPEDREYSVKLFDLTSNIDHALSFIKNIHAAGGGDYPEAVTDGLNEGINNVHWRPDARKLIFLIGDAPPHGEGNKDTSFRQGSPLGNNYKQNIRDAVQKEIRIYTISGSGMDNVGLKIWKEIAHKTGGKFEKLDYYRVPIQKYVEENQLDAQWVETVQADADYEASSKSFIANTLGSFAMGAMKTEAQEMGVSYSDPVSSDYGVEVESGSLLSADTIVEIEVPADGSDDGLVDYADYETGEKESRFYSFIKSILNRLVFWA